MTDLTAAIEQLAWTAARGKLGPPTSDAEQREAWLAVLTSLLAIRDSAEQLAASAALSAAERGADYPAIGAAAGMTRQGARRKWPGLAGLTDERQRKLTWWHRRGNQFERCVRAVLATSDGPRVAALRDRLAEITRTSPAQSLAAFDLALIDAVAVAATTPADPAAARACGLLAALTADAYVAMSSVPALAPRPDRSCGTAGCPAEPLVELWRPDLDRPAVPACHDHAVSALGEPATRIVAAHRQDVAPSIFEAAHGGD